MKTTALLLLSLTLTASPATAALFGSIEAPNGIGSQIANIQGWVYTTAPGAELIQPFSVRINGEDAFLMPCCGDRLDVADARPDAPLRTGFSAVHNFARTAQQEETATIEIIVEDSSGDSITLSKTVDLFALSLDVPYVRELAFMEPDLVDPSNVRQGWCSPSNDGTFADGTVELVCHNLVAKTPTESGTCDEVRYSWDRGSQGLKQTSDCVPQERWTDHGDGTATDHWTGLLWEIKTEEGIHDVDRTFEWSSGDDRPTGPAFNVFLGELNGSMGEGCFAGHCDWRLPTVAELHGIVEPSPDCVGPASPISGCTSIPGRTSGDSYFTSETADKTITKARVVDFANGIVRSEFKHSFDVFVSVRGEWYVRAVRRPAPWE